MNQSRECSFLIGLFTLTPSVFLDLKPASNISCWPNLFFFILWVEYKRCEFVAPVDEYVVRFLFENV